MSCNCFSLAYDDGIMPGVIVCHPTEADRTVALDACIASAVQHLWAHDIGTLGCCCGHGRSFASIVLAHHEDAVRARDLLSAFEPGRRIELSAWVLAALGTSGG